MDEKIQSIFEDAIQAGRLSRDENALNYAGNYMYMHTAKDIKTGAFKTYFKNINLRAYDV